MSGAQFDVLLVVPFMPLCDRPLAFTVTTIRRGKFENPLSFTNLPVIAR